MALPLSHQPRDYAPPDDWDEHDPTGYYARKEVHRAEMLPYVGACIVAAIACVLVAVVWNLIS